MMLYSNKSLLLSFIGIILIITYCPLRSASFAPQAPHLSRNHQHQHVISTTTTTTTTVAVAATKKILSEHEINQAILPLMELSAAGFVSQALNAFVQLGIPDILGNEEMTVSTCTSNA